MKIIGITGGIGSGKSVVSKLLQLFGFPVYNSDQEAKKLYDTHLHIRQKLEERFGNEIYTANKLNRPLLAKIIFNSESERNFVNSIIHPEIKKDFTMWAEAQKKELVFIESAILIESGFHQMTHQNIVVSSPENIRIQRIKERDHCSMEQAEARIKSQLTDNERLKVADFEIKNNGGKSLIKQVEEICLLAATQNNLSATINQF